MREIRSGIAQRHGIDLTQQQIQELAARRLEAILDPRTVKPSLLEQLRKSAGDVGGTGTKEATPAFAFEDTTLYETHNDFLRFARRLLNPILKLFFNPNPLIQALNTQARLNAAFARREDERDRRQAEWNALHYTLLQRLVLELSRSTVDAQTLAARVESVGARVDFNDRRLRAVEGTGPGPAQRPAEAAWSPGPASGVTTGSSAAPFSSSSSPSASSPSVSMRAAGGDGSTGDASPEARRRRKRRRGRRSGAAGEGGPLSDTTGEGSLRDADEAGDADGESNPPNRAERPLPERPLPTAPRQDFAAREPAEAGSAGTERDGTPVSSDSPEAPAAAFGPGSDTPDR